MAPISGAERKRSFHQPKKKKKGPRESRDCPGKKEYDFLLRDLGKNGILNFGEQKGKMGKELSWKEGEENTPRKRRFQFLKKK